MADNTTLPSGSGGDTLRTEDRGSFKTPVSLIDVGGTAGEALIGDGSNAMPIKDGGNSITVDATSLPLPTGASTAAHQVTQNTSLSSIEANLSNLEAALGSIGGDSLTVSNGGVAFGVSDAGGSLTVDGTVAATQSGTWNVTNISGTVSLPTGAATETTLSGIGTNIFILSQAIKLEDGAHLSGDAGIPALSVRNDSDTSLCGTSGDYTPLQVDANGYLKVNIKAGAGSGGTALTDDAAFTAATTSFTPIGGIVTSDSVDSGDGGAFAMLANRQQKVTLYDSSGVEVSVGGGTQYDEDAVHSSGSKVTGAGVVRKDTAASLCGADGDYSLLIVDANGRLHVNPSLPTDAATASHQVTQNSSLVDITGHCFGILEALNNQNPASDTVALEAGNLATIAAVVKSEDAIHSSGDAGIMSLAVRSDTATAIAANGDYHPLLLDATGRLHVNPGTVTVNAHAVTNAGTFAVQVDGNALTSLQLIDDVIFVDDAAFTLGTSKIAAIGGRASRARRTAESAEGDAAVIALDRYGRVQTAPGPDLTVSATQVTASGDTSLVAAPGAGSRLKILRVEASNSHATVAVTAGLKSTSLNGGSVFGKKYLPAVGGQAAWVFPNGHLMCGDNEAFSANLSAGSTTIEYTVYYETVTT